MKEKKNRGKKTLNIKKNEKKRKKYNEVKI